MLIYARRFGCVGFKRMTESVESRSIRFGSGLGSTKCARMRSNALPYDRLTPCSLRSLLGAKVTMTDAMLGVAILIGDSQ
ncbi:hypothetical protein CKO42_22730 [Lamprobacter modestohalophilus]|uniref:Uncharacterized protein n=1 Tax=Lamprobacter modestohalophilus TaxID=1064514 RepID=A0A9X1B634_9GAMM|nr:hypothetical protein [Lamprobacter modestohalophilus]